MGVTFQVLDGIDKGRVQQFLTELQRRFQGAYVYDLGALRETASNVLPVLQQFDETRPLAAWLQTRLDYFDIAEELRRDARVAPDKPAPNPSPSPPHNEAVPSRFPAGC